MTRRFHPPTAWASGLLAGALALAATTPASAQVWGLGGPNLWGYTGVLPSYGALPSPIPNTWITPDYVFEYQVPQVVYVPVPVQVAPKQPAFEPVQVATITFARGAAPADARVKAGTVVTWRNDDNQDDTLVMHRHPRLGRRVGTPPKGGASRPRAASVWSSASRAATTTTGCRSPITGRASS